DGPNFPVPNANTSAVQTFTITVNPINDAPTFNLPSNPPLIVIGSGLQTVPNFTTGMSVGPANESSQALTSFLFTQTASTGGLTFSTPPTINTATGTLTYQ